MVEIGPKYLHWNAESEMRSIGRVYEIREQELSDGQLLGIETLSDAEFAGVGV